MIDDLAPPTERDILRFLSKTAKAPGSDCWIWTAHRNHNGYGKATFRGKRYRAHRLSFAFFNKKKIGKLMVCHSCDNPGCVNPSHLFLGTGRDNIHDSIKKGRRIQMYKNRKAPRRKPRVLDSGPLKSKICVCVSMTAEQHEVIKENALIRHGGNVSFFLRSLGIDFK